MTDPAADAVIAEAFAQIGKPYVLGTEGPDHFDCSGLVYYCFDQTGYGALVGTTRKLAAGYAHYFGNAGQFSRNFSDAQPGDLICYSENGTHVSHIALYIGNGEIISALIPPFGVRKTRWDGINVAFYGVCLVPYSTYGGRTGPDSPGGSPTDPETGQVISGSPAQVTAQILYQGVDITAYVEFASARFMTQAGGLPGESDLRVKDATHIFSQDYFHAGGTLELWLNDRREWDGWVINVTREWAFPVDITTDPSITPRYWHLVGYDRNFLFSRRFCYDQSNPHNTNFGTYPAGALDIDVVKDVLANYVDLQDDGLDLVSGITQVGPIDPYEPVKVAETGEMWGDAMRLIGALNGALTYIDPDRVVRYVDDTTDTAPFALSDEPLVGEVGYREMMVNIDATQLANEALIWGVGTGNSSPVFAIANDAASQAEHGLFQYAEVYEGLYEQLSVQRRADTYIDGTPQHLRGHKDDVIRITCSIFQPGLRVGEGVSFHSGVWDFSDLTYGPGDLVYNPANYDKSTEFQRMLQSIGRIESNNNYTRQNKRTAAYGQWQVMPANWRVWGPLALGLPLSSGVATRDLDPSLWYPPPTPANQDIVVGWRMGQLYNNKGQDPRRVAASWRSGPSVGSRDPSTWSQGTILYVNHACVPLGYPPVDFSTVLDPISNPTSDVSTEYQATQNIDDVYPVRKVEITFPTPSGCRYDLTLSHEYDVAWSYQDPLKTPTNPTYPGGPLGEQIVLAGNAPITTEPQPSSTYDANIGEVFTVSCRGWARRGVYGHNAFAFPNEVWVQDGGNTSSDQINPSDTAPGIYSSIGRGGGFQALLADVITNPCATDGWTNWEDCEQWYGPISSTLADMNKGLPFELRVANSPQLVQGYVPSVVIGIAEIGPQDGAASGSTSYGEWAEIGRSQLVGDPNVIGYDPNWSTLYGQPLMPVEYESILIQPGTLAEGDWIVVSPGWSCDHLDYPGLMCDTSTGIWGSDPTAIACSHRGPQCTGMGNSGEFAGSGAFQSVNLTLLGRITEGSDSWENLVAADTQNAPASYWANGIYRTHFSYTPGTLQITWQGVTLTAGVDFVELDPVAGTFQIKDQLSGEGTITVTYYPTSDLVPTQPLPGEPSGASPSASAEAFVQRAIAMLGTPYVLGAESLTACDCSGLVFRCFMDSGNGAIINNERLLAAGYCHYFANENHFTTDFSQAQRGDLIGYTDPGTNHIGHIGIYMGDGTVISALVPPDGVTRTGVFKLDVNYYGVCLVPFGDATVRTGSDTPPGSGTDPESGTTTDAPPLPTGIAAKVYRPRSQSMFGWGTQYDGVNALMAAGAIALDRQTLGVYSDIAGTPRATAPNMRTYSGVTGPQSGVLGDLAIAWSAGWSQTLEQPDPISYQEFVKQIQVNLKGAVVNGITTSLPTTLQLRPNWSGEHYLYVNEMLSDGSFWVCDPLGHNSEILSADEMYQYATSSIGFNLVKCAFTRPSPEMS